MELDPDLISRLSTRIGLTAALPVQLRGGPHGRGIDPLRGTRVLFNSRRASRPREGVGGCFFCDGQTPPTLFYIEELGGGSPGRPVVETETETAALLSDYRDTPAEGDMPDPWESLLRLGDARRSGPEGEPVPLVEPARPWLVRTFLNFVPLLVDPDSAANCFVVSVPPAYHDCDLGALFNPGGGPAVWDKPAPAGGRTPRAQGRGRQRVLPVGILEAVVMSWAVMEQWSRSHGLVTVPFINGGKSRASGQSLDHFHSQVYALGPADCPPLYESLARGRTAACPVCDILGDEGLYVRGFGTVAVAVHPAPARDLTLVVAPFEERSHLAEVESADLAAALSWAIRSYEELLGGVPAYVVAVRTGESVGHLHAEIVPRSHVNVPGGFEETTGLAVATRDPRDVARLLRDC